MTVTDAEREREINPQKKFQDKLGFEPRSWSQIPKLTFILWI